MSRGEFQNLENNADSCVEYVAASTKSARGFAKMDPERQKEIAKKGGVAAHRSGHAHKFSPEEARAAGKKGGKAVSENRQHMAEIGRRGGEARKKKAYVS